MDHSDFAIRDYALIGDTHTAALVAPDGSVDWCCFPEFDSPAVFCRLLDPGRGGSFRVGPTGKFSASHSYVEPTNVLQTTFETSSGRIRLTDFMPLERAATESKREERKTVSSILRLVEGLAGNVELEVVFCPTFDYARAQTQFTAFEGGAVARAENRILKVQCPAELKPRKSGGLSGRMVLAQGKRVWIELSYHESSNGDHVARVSSHPDAALSRTVSLWRSWWNRCTYHGPYADLVRRSALTLKLMTFAPTGALVAAPTTSLPECPGGSRNWDYRFTWLRDSSLTIYALQLLGYHQEATDFLEWLNDLEFAGRRNLQVLYSIRGETDLAEQTLDHLAGYRHSRPVRIGNDAFRQRQFDVYGEVLDAAFLYHERLKKPLPKKWWDEVCYLAGEAGRMWRKPDSGIWEFRREQKHFVYSKLMCWVALDRASKLRVNCQGQHGEAAWAMLRDEIRDAILTEGYNEKIGAFTQTLGGSDLDATGLMIPIVGFLPATDQRVLSTMERIREQLSSHGLVYRYLTDDGLPGNEATFAVCSFWLIDNLALAGRVDEARELFERVAGHASGLGLFSEEIDPVSGDLWGNYPQGFTHLALIRSAFHIAKAESLGAEAEVQDPAERAEKMEQAGHLPESGPPDSDARRRKGNVDETSLRRDM